MLKEIKSLLGQDVQEIQVAEPKAGLIIPNIIACIFAAIGVVSSVLFVK